MHLLEKSQILTIHVDNTNYEDATHRILTWAKYGENRYVSVANVHTVMEAKKDKYFRKIVYHSDMVTPDGMPLVWAMRMLGLKNQTRVYGPRLTLQVCERASELGVSVGFLGGNAEAIKFLVKNISNRYPSLRIGYAHSPPFRDLRQEEDEEIVRSINNAGIKILFVGLGCPKQEHWMYHHQGRINAVMIGVGAAFDFHAGIKKQAPGWLMAIGLEWLFRLCMEPRRLWRRYLYNNPQFLFLMARQILKKRQLRC